MNRAAKWFVTITGLSETIPTNLKSAANALGPFPKQVEVRTNVFASGHPVLAFSDAHFWSMEFFTFQKREICEDFQLQDGSTIRKGEGSILIKSPERKEFGICYDSLTPEEVTRFFNAIKKTGNVNYDTIEHLL